MLSFTAFRIIALLEGVSFLLLLGVAMPLKYIYMTPLAGAGHRPHPRSFIHVVLRVPDHDPQAAYPACQSRRLGIPGRHFTVRYTCLRWIY